MVKNYNHFCVAKKCYNSRNAHPTKGFFGFPYDANLCKAWLANCGRNDLNVESVRKSAGYYKMCSDHFEDKYFTSSSRTLLNRQINPVPTIFFENSVSLLSASSKTDRCIEIDLDLEQSDAQICDEASQSSFHEPVEDNSFPLSFKTTCLLQKTDFDAETISQALLNLDPQCELHRIEELCRFCLNKPHKRSSLDLFANSVEAMKVRQISDSILPGKELAICDGLPHKACQQCVSDLKMCYELMEKFKDADKYLRSIAKYSLFIDNGDDNEDGGDNVEPAVNITKNEIPVQKEVLKSIPKKAMVMPLKTLKPVIDGFKGYLQEAPVEERTSSALGEDLQDLGTFINSENDREEFEADNQSISIRSSDNDTSVSQLLNSLPLQTPQLVPSEQELWEIPEDIDLVCNRVVIKPRRKEVLQKTQPLGNQKKPVHSNTQSGLSKESCPQENPKSTNLNRSIEEGKTDLNSTVSFDMSAKNVGLKGNNPKLVLSYKCLECLKIFSSYEVLRDHVLNSHHKLLNSQTPFSCEYCPKKYKSPALFARHVKVEHRRKIRCKECGIDQEWFASVSHFVKHFQEKHKPSKDMKEKLKCNQCESHQEGFSTSAELMKHIKENHVQRCEKCGYMFYSKERMEKHMATQHQASCSECNKQFDTYKAKKNHERVHENETEMCWICGATIKKIRFKAHLQKHNSPSVPHQCDICNKVLKSKELMRSHRKKHFIDNSNIPKNYACDKCPKRFAHKFFLYKHSFVHTSEKNFKCDFCNFRFKLKDGLLFHLRRRAEKGGVCPRSKVWSGRDREKSTQAVKPKPPLAMRTASHACDICGKKFIKDINKKRHMMLHTCSGDPEIIKKLLNEPERHNCTICGQFFFSRFSFKRHVGKHNNDEKPFKCDFCTMSFRTYGQLFLHERTHTGEKPFECSDCGKCFITKTNLKNHTEAVHSSSRNYICQICGASFKTRVSLHEHTFRHEDASLVRPFSCTHCGNQFMTESILKTHIKRTHSLEDQQVSSSVAANGFPCPECGKFLKTKEQCKKHMRRMHRMFRGKEISKKEMENEIKLEIRPMQFLTLAQDEQNASDIALHAVQYLTVEQDVNTYEEEIKADEYLNVDQDDHNSNEAEIQSVQYLTVDQDELLCNEEEIQAVQYLTVDQDELHSDEEIQAVQYLAVDHDKLTSNDEEIQAVQYLTVDEDEQYCDEEEIQAVQYLAVTQDGQRTIEEEIQAVQFLTVCEDGKDSNNIELQGLTYILSDVESTV